jgi:hypothetical protein
MIDKARSLFITGENKMSKIGRYSADRKKIQNLSSVYTASVADCGTVFTLSTGASAYSVTLPSVAKAGNGWWCKFILTDTTTSTCDITVSCSSDDTRPIFLRNVPGTSSIGAGAQIQMEVVGGTNITGGAAFTFDVSACAINDQVELVCDGTNFYGQSVTSGSNAVVNRQV